MEDAQSLASILSYPHDYQLIFKDLQISFLLLVITNIKSGIL